MFTRQLAAFLSCILLASSSLSAQQSAASAPPAPQRDPQAIDLLGRCSAAMGSPDLATTVQASGTMIPFNQSDPSVPLVLKSKGNDKQLWQLNSSATQESIVFNGGFGKSVRNSQSQPIPAWQAMYARGEHFPALLCGFELQRTDMDIVYVGLDSVRDTSVHHIKISAIGTGKSKAADAARRIISEFHIFLDAKSFVVLKTKRFAFSPEAIENHSDFETYYGKYALVSGVLMPFEMTCFDSDRKLWTVALDTIQLNASVSDTDFAF